ncbi:MAG: 30S ribosomal protein S5 [Elusimicrobia bacterium]|nr:30S ribosomal protein S5 [Elusimicrobiota bacterium]
MVTLEKSKELIERVVSINRVASVVKGGKRFGFSTLVVVGDGKGRVGAGIGKANDVRASIEKGIAKAKTSMIEVELTEDNTITHSVIGKFGAAEILLKPAGPGTGVISGGAARAVLESVGIENVLTKCLRSRNPINVVRATLDGLSQTRSRSLVARMREKEEAEL